MEKSYTWRGNFTLEGASKRRSKKCYQHLQLPDQTIISTGDTVLIDNIDGEDFVAVVEEFYDNNESVDSKRAVVQWYLRKSELSALAELRLPTVAHERELFLFDRPKFSLVEVDIDAETIISNCMVEEIYTDDSLPTSVAKDGKPFYFVRWTFNGEFFAPVFSDDIVNSRVTTKQAPAPKQNNEEEEEEDEEEGKDEESEDEEKWRNDKNRTKRKTPVTTETQYKTAPQGKKTVGTASRKSMEVDEALDVFFSSGDDFTPRRSYQSKTKVPKSTKKFIVRNVNFREDDICALDLDTTIYDTVKARNKSEKVLKGLTRDFAKCEDEAKLKTSRTPGLTSRIAGGRKGEATPLRRRSSRLTTPKSCPPLEKGKSGKSREAVHRGNRKLNFGEDEPDTSSSTDDDEEEEEAKKEKQTKLRRLKRKGEGRSETPKTASKLPTKRRKDTPRHITASHKVPQSCPEPQAVSRRPSRRKAPKRRINFSSIKEEDESDEWDGGNVSDEGSDNTTLSRRRVTQKPPRGRKPVTPKTKYSAAAATPQIRSRKTPRKMPSKPLEQARVRLHVSAVPSSLPCREDEFTDILSFVKGHLIDKLWGCLYISGVPGTGKTATVHAMLDELNGEVQEGTVPDFQTIEINGMRLTEPHQAFVQILKHLTGQKATPQHAAALLEKYFAPTRQRAKPVVLIVDELDLLWTRKQDVLYSIFDWPTKPKSGLIVVAIANTMDLPERIMMNRVSSRLGLSRMTFQPYTFKQLQEIVEVRLQGLRAFDSEAIQLAARKVAALSGDARRALDICRRATEIAESNRQRGTKGTVGLNHVEWAVEEMFCSPKIMAIRHASKQEQIFLRGLMSEFRQTGLEETTFEEVLKQHVSLCRLQGFTPPSVSEIWSVCVRLASSKLLLLEAGFNEISKRILLNVSQDDVRFALSQSES